MSVVAGLVDNGEVYMAADSGCMSLDHSWIREDDTPKVWRQEQFLVGVVGKQRVADIIMEDIVPERKVTPVEFADLVRVALKMRGALKIRDAIETMEAEILLGWRGGLYHVVSDFGVFVPREKYHAIGAGAQYALGALHVMAGQDWVPGTKVDMAVEAASAFSPYVSGRTRGLKLKTGEAA